MLALQVRKIHQPVLMLSNALFKVSFADVHRGRNTAWVFNSKQAIEPDDINAPFKIS